MALDTGKEEKKRLIESAHPTQRAAAENAVNEAKAKESLEGRGRTKENM